MKPEDIKKTLQSGGKVFGTMINFVEGSRWATAFSSKALDYVIIDAEHGSYSRGEVARMVAIGQSVGLSVIVRVADPDPTLVAIALDSRADGVLVMFGILNMVSRVGQIVSFARPGFGRVSVFVVFSTGRVGPVFGFSVF